MSPHALLALAAAGGALYWYTQRQGAAVGIPGGSLEPVDTSNAEGLFSGIDAGAPVDYAAVDASINVQLDSAFGAGAALLDNLGLTMTKSFQLPPTAAPYLDTINAASAAQGLPDGLLARVLYEESHFRADIISGDTISPAGALGIAQFMPATAQQLGVDPFNPNKAIPGAAKYLKQLFDQLGTWPEAIAAYNWGIGNVQRKGLAAAPAETKKYVSSIMGDLPNLT